jgi:phosphoheptose isomerase
MLVLELSRARPDIPRSLRNPICEWLYEAHDAIEAAIGDEAFIQAIEDSARVIAESLRKGGSILIAGNGGSAAQAQHFAAELVGRFQRERAGLAAIALGADHATLTALANDYGYENALGRQLCALRGHDCVLVAISTSGTSANVLRAAELAFTQEVPVIAMTSCSGARLIHLSNIAIVAPACVTAVVQQLHLVAAHAICGLVETILFGPGASK